MNYQPGDVANGHILGDDGIWHPITSPDGSAATPQSRPSVNETARKPRAARNGRRFTFVALITVLVLITGWFVASSATANEATIERVIDGDTVDVRIDGKTTRIRLLNIDTPETKNPQGPVECLGSEASEFTERLLPKGTKVSLDYDVEREDRYGRTLAHVKLTDGRYVSDELARNGLGDAVVFGKNDARYSEVKQALLEASQAERGLFDPDIDCTVAHRTSQVEQALTEAQAVDSGSSAAEALAAAAAVLALYETVSAVEDLAERSGHVVTRAYGTVGRASEVTSLRTKTDSIKDIGGKHEEAAASRKASEEAKAAEAAAAKVEAERLAAIERAKRNQQTAAPTKPKTPTSKKPKSSGSSSNPYPGYTGPRCYAPGGKTWRPC